MNKSVKMADYEKPVNNYDFKKGEKPDVHRAEEQFMYKYLSQVEKKVPKSADESDDGFEETLDRANFDEEVSDPEMEAFAEAEIRKEMKRLQSGAGAVDLDEDDDVSYSDEDQNNNG